MSKDFENRVRIATQKINEWLKPLGVQTIIMLQGRLGEGMIDNPNPTYPTGLDELQNVTGRLFRSFALNSPETLSEVIGDANGLEINFGSDVPYAAIHEYGGKTEEGWKIPARQYFSKGIERFEQKDLDKLKNEIKQTLIVNLAKYL